MENHLSSFALSIFILFNSISAAIVNSATDKHALLSFKNSITSDPDAILRTKWSEDTSVCNWIGVTCGIKHQRVTALNLSGFDLAGTVAPHLGNLTFLRYLDISSNNFTGFLPSELSKLRRLKVMNVGVNSFTGEIPTWFDSLLELEQVYLHNNSFSGTIPPSLFNISKLQTLEMGFNLLSGSIPHGIFNMSSMKDLRIRGNSLSGSLPTDMCNNLPNINTISLSYNQLEDWVSEASQQNAAIEISAPALLSREEKHFTAKERCVSSIFELAMKCLAVSADERINMTEAAAALHKINATLVAATAKLHP